MQQLTGPHSLFRYQSGRVIALGRVMLGIMFLLATWLNPDTADTAPDLPLLVTYLALAVAFAGLTWRNWWLDARLAVPAHAVDMAVFTVIVFSTNGTTSPFFLFFVLPLLSAAIRWGWRDTAITAAVLILLYFSAGVLVARTQSFELERFIVRSGHLTILSALLIWFGIHQRSTRMFLPDGIFDTQLGATEEPLVVALDLAIEAAGAGGGALLVGPDSAGRYKGVRTDGTEVRTVAIEGPLIKGTNPRALLVDVARDRALEGVGERRRRFLDAGQIFDDASIEALGLTEALVSPIQTGMQRGWLVLSGIHDLSTDYIEVGREIGLATGAVLDRQTLLAAIEDGAEVRTRLSVARDLHDGVVQFLAGTAFRVEAMKRAAASGAPILPELDELKRLLVEEQGDIRGLLHVLRGERRLNYEEAVRELKTLTARLGQQWSIDCALEAAPADRSIPIRLQLDLQQLLREAVANAVRHGGAEHIRVGFGIDDGALRLRVEDDGRGFRATGQSRMRPRSLTERVERAGGSLRLASKRGSTTIDMTLPLSGAAA